MTLAAKDNIDLLAINLPAKNWVCRPYGSKSQSLKVSRGQSDLTLTRMTLAWKDKVDLVSIDLPAKNWVSRPYRSKAMKESEFLTCVLRSSQNAA